MLLAVFSVAQPHLALSCSGSQFSQPGCWFLNSRLAFLPINSLHAHIGPSQSVLFAVKSPNCCVKEEPRAEWRQELRSSELWFLSNSLKRWPTSRCFHFGRCHGHRTCHLSYKVWSWDNSVGILVFLRKSTSGLKKPLSLSSYGVVPLKLLNHGPHFPVPPCHPCSFCQRLFCWRLQAMHVISAKEGPTKQQMWLCFVNWKETLLLVFKRRRKLVHEMLSWSETLTAVKMMVSQAV